MRYRSWVVTVTLMLSGSALWAEAPLPTSRPESESSSFFCNLICNSPSVCLSSTLNDRCKTVCRTVKDCSSLPNPGEQTSLLTSGKISPPGMNPEPDQALKGNETAQGQATKAESTQDASSASDSEESSEGSEEKKEENSENKEEAEAPQEDGEEKADKGAEDENAGEGDEAASEEGEAKDPAESSEESSNDAANGDSDNTEETRQ